MWDGHLAAAGCIFKKRNRKEKGQPFLQLDKAEIFSIPSHSLAWIHMLFLNTETKSSENICSIGI